MGGGLQGARARYVEIKSNGYVFGVRTGRTACTGAVVPGLGRCCLAPVAPAPVVDDDADNSSRSGTTAPSGAMVKP